jgi:signal transduction histidine kinase
MWFTRNPIRRFFLACLLSIGWVPAPLSAANQTADVYTQQEKESIRANPVVRFAVYPNGQPFMHLEGGKPVGVAVEYLQAIAKASGLTFEPVVVTDIGQARQALQRHELDLLPVLTSSGSTGTSSVLMTTPYFVGTAVVITRASTASIFELSRLQGMHVAVRCNSLIYRLLQSRYPTITLLPVATPGDELSLVSNGLADAAVDVDAMLLPLWRKMYFSNLHVSGSISDVLVRFSMGVRSDQPLLAAVIDKSLSSLTAKQTDVMMAKWMGDSDYGATSWRVHFRFHAWEISAALMAMVGLAFLYRRARRERRRAERSEREKAMFLAVMSHEIRVPLSAVLSSVDLLRRTRVSKHQAALLATAGSAADALQRLVDDVLDLSKLEANGLQLSSTPTDIRELLREVVEIVRHKVDQKGLQFKVDIDISEAHILLDAMRLQQILVNLLTNAVKFTHHGSVALRVVLERSDGGSIQRKLTVSVCDTGIGIPPEQHTRLFHAYVQADSTIARRYGGTGLGLSISRQLIELMGGAISLRSEVNVGTTISFWIPVQLASTQMAGPGKDSSARGSTEPGLARHVSVLLIEDHPANRFVFEQQLRSIGCKVTACADGASALRVSNHALFDLVLMDCDLPDMSGYELARAMRERESESDRHTPILALSASTDATHKMACIDCGMDGILKKPLQLSLLCSEIRVWCDVDLPDPGVFDDEGNVEAS